MGGSDGGWFIEDECHKCAHLQKPNSGGGHRYEIDCHGFLGKYIMVQLPGKQRLFNFQELEAYIPAMRYDVVHDEVCSGGSYATTVGGTKEQCMAQCNAETACMYFGHSYVW